MNKAEERIAKIREEASKAQERAKKKTAEAVVLQRQMRNRETAEERKRDLRRKILIGSMEIHKAESSNIYKEQLMLQLSEYLKRDDDRRIFGLSPLMLDEESTAPTTVESRKSSDND